MGCGSEIQRHFKTQIVHLKDSIADKQTQRSVQVKHNCNNVSVVICFMTNI